MASGIGELEPRGCGEEKAEMEKWICHDVRGDPLAQVRKTAALAFIFGYIGYELSLVHLSCVSSLSSERFPRLADEWILLYPHAIYTKVGWCL